MIKKWQLVSGMIGSALISGVIGFFAGGSSVKCGTVVCKYGDSIVTYGIKSEHMRGCSLSMAGGSVSEEPFDIVNISKDIDLKGVNNVSEAISRIEKYISDNSGEVISSSIM